VITPLMVRPGRVAVWPTATRPGRTMRGVMTHHGLADEDLSGPRLGKSDPRLGKEELRRGCHDRRAAVDHRTRMSRDDRRTEHAMSRLLWAHKVALYLSRGDEPDTVGLADTLVMMGKQVLAPVLTDDHAHAGSCREWPWPSVRTGARTCFPIMTRVSASPTVSGSSPRDR
ncbi:hypothetical protein B6N42_11920, partial [Cutibacterium avidum]